MIRSLSYVSQAEETNNERYLFESIADPRIERCKKHRLLDILLLSISAVISSAESWIVLRNTVALMQGSLGMIPLLAYCAV